MSKRLVRFSFRAATLCLGYLAFSGGCLAFVQRELEVLFRAESNPLLIGESFLVDVFGLQILKLFN